MPRSDWVTPREAAIQKGVSRSTVIAWILAGELPALNVAARADGQPRYRIHRQDLDRFQRQRMTAGVVA